MSTLLLKGSICNLSRSGDGHKEKGCSPPSQISNRKSCFEFFLPCLSSNSKYRKRRKWGFCFWLWIALNLGPSPLDKMPKKWSTEICLTHASWRRLGCWLFFGHFSSAVLGAFSKCSSRSLCSDRKSHSNGLLIYVSFVQSSVVHIAPSGYVITFDLLINHFLFENMTLLDRFFCKRRQGVLFHNDFLFYPRGLLHLSLSSLVYPSKG